MLYSDIHITLPHIKNVFSNGIDYFQELQSHYDEVTRQLQQAIDQLGVAQRRCQTLQIELDEMRSALEQVSKHFSKLITSVTRVK